MQPLRVCTIVAVCAGLLLAACREQMPRIADDFDLKAARCTPPVRCYLQAPIILVGTVTGVRQVASTRPAMHAPQALLDPVEIRVEVEQVVKGDAGVGTASVFGFLYSSKNTRYLGLPAFQPAPGQRRLFFLRREAGVLRLFRDVMENYYVVLYNGRHPTSGEAQQTEAGKRLARLLLTLGANPIPDGFASNLVHYVYIAQESAGAEYTLELLSPLTVDKDPLIRKEALEIRQAYMKGSRVGGGGNEDCTRCPNE